MKTWINSRWAVIVPLVMAGLFGTLLAASPASADTISLDLDVGNCPLNRVRFPFATVTVTLTTATTAHVTFDSGLAAHCSNTSGCTMGGLNAADLNVNAAAFTVGPVTEAGGGVWQPPVITTAGFVACFGKFNLRVKNVDGLATSTTKIEFDVIRLVGTWSSALNVLAPNNFGHVAAAHIYAPFGIGYATNNP